MHEWQKRREMTDDKTKENLEKIRENSANNGCFLLLILAVLVFQTCVGMGQHNG